MVKTSVLRHRSLISTSDKLFDFLIGFVGILSLVIILFPLLHVLASSFSSGTMVQSGKITIFPLEPTFTAYKMVFAYKEVWTGYANTIYYTIVGTALSIICTIMAAYPLSRKDLVGRGPIMSLYVFTMLFGGGLIPFYLLVKNLHLINTPWALWLPGLVSIYNMIVMRTYFQSTIPTELLEAARIDGCSNWRFLLTVAIPLSGSIIAVMVLLYAISLWNNYFTAMLFLTSKSKYPLQLILREILIANQVNFASLSGSDVKELLKRQEMKILLKYALIVIGSVPLLVVYPFIQKYFVKGVMIGSLKG